jgi:polyphosphate glucokinase
MRASRDPVTLAVDIGGTGIKAMRLDGRGRPISERVREKTPQPATPARILRVIADLAARLGDFDRVSVGFPGVVDQGTIKSAANLHPSWIGFRLRERLARLLHRPTRVANDADVQGLGIVEGRGAELVITLGTGVGSALFIDGRHVHLELGHHPFHRGKTYEDLLGDRKLKRIGVERWNHRVRRAVDMLLQTFIVRRLYLGGGNARLVEGRLPPQVRVASNLAGLLGGIRLWELESAAEHRPPPTSRRRARRRRSTSRSAG